MDFRSTTPSRNVVDHTNRLTESRMAGTDPEFMRALLAARENNAPSQRLLDKKHRHNFDPALAALFAIAMRQFGNVKDSSSFEDFKR